MMISDQKRKILCGINIFVNLMILSGSILLFLVFSRMEIENNKILEKEIQDFNSDNKFYNELCYVTKVSNIVVDNSSFVFVWNGYLYKDDNRIVFESIFNNSNREETEKNHTFLLNNVKNTTDKLPINCYSNKSKLYLEDLTKTKKLSIYGETHTIALYFLSFSSLGILSLLSYNFFACIIAELLCEIDKKETIKNYDNNPIIMKSDKEFKYDPEIELTTV